MEELFRAVFAPLREPSIASLAPIAAQFTLIAAFDTVVFDAIHRALHLCARWGFRLLLVVTDARGAYGGALADVLRGAGGLVETLQHGRDFSAEGMGEAADEVMRRADVLVLCHGVKRGPTMGANCHSFVSLTERFLSLTGDRPVPVEVWAVGFEAELHPGLSEEMKAYRASKCAFAQHARRWIHDESFLYRHIVPSGFRSSMGFGLMSARTAAVVSLLLIRRGFRYVPVTYTGIALLNWLLFVFRPRACSEQAS